MIRKSINLLREFSAFLLLGTVIALVWANLDYHSYHEFIDKPIAFLNFLGHHAGEPLPLTFHFIVNDMFMVLFFGIAMKEVSESFLPGGALSSVSKASMPAIATMGGVLGPIAFFFAFLYLANYSGEGIHDAWAVPTATDIAYSWLFAGIIFGRKHPAVLFLLVLAVLDDLVGMIIIAVFYSGQIQIEYLLLVLAALLIAEIFRRMRVRTFWFYLLLPGILSWYGLLKAGVHPSLALVPIMPFLPHSARDTGMFANDDRHDTMNEYEHFFKPVVDIGLFFFGLANAGVQLSAQSFLGAPTWAIFLSLFFGKTTGIFLFGYVSMLLGLKLPDRMHLKDLFVMGMVAGIGFTVALFVATVASEAHPHWNEAGITGMLKLGALLSFFSGVGAWVLSRILKTHKING